MFSKDILSHGRNSAETCSLLRISTALCCALFSDTVCCDSHGALRGGKKRVQKCKYCTEAGSAASATELFLPAAELGSALVHSLSLCWQLQGHAAILGTRCSFIPTDRRSRLGLAKHSWSSTVQLAPPRRLALAGQARV